MEKKMHYTQQLLSDVTIWTKFAKYIPEIQRRETWEEICDRNQSMHVHKFPFLKDEIKNIYKYVRDYKILPSMRSMQFAGLPIELNNSRMFNCAFAAVNDPHVFAETMALLLGGTGVGISVQKHHIELLPIVKGPTEKKRRFLISDSIEGWAEAIKVLTKAYFRGKADPVFDYRDIRPKGERLVTSGGKAPGPDPLRICIEEIRKVFNNAIGRKLKPIEAHDAICYIADAVLAGGIRRAALISLFSKDDLDMFSAKFGNWYEENPQRGRANNSVVLKRDEITEEEFKNIWRLIELSKTGEPGIFWTNDLEIGCNPCAEISLQNANFCVAGDTKLITKNGIDRIDNLIGKEIEIWNGEKWSLTKPFKTGDADELYRVIFSDGSYLDVTNNHKFLAKNRFEKAFNEYTTLELIELLKTTKYNIQVPRYKMIIEGGIFDENSYSYGVFLGDGHLEKNNIICCLYGEKIQIQNHINCSLVGEETTQLNYNVKKQKVKLLGLNRELCENIKENDGIPSYFYTLDKQSIVNFISGWIDTDGSKTVNGIRVYSTEGRIRDLQLLLTKIGINSSANLMQNKGTETNFGKRNQAIWYVQFNDTTLFTESLKRVKLNIPTENKHNGKGKYQNIKSIHKLVGVHKSYCLEERELHQCVFNNVLTKQCNLVEVNVSDVINQEDLNNRVKNATFLATLQASYTDFHYLRPIWKENAERDALIGVSQTGISSNKTKELNLEEAARIVVEENKRVASLIGINPAKRTTTGKPAGTTSCVLGTSSGIHAWHDHYYIRRIRIGKTEAIYHYLKEIAPELIEDCIFKPHLEAVMSFPQKAPDTAITRNESVFDLLERVKRYYKEWIIPGHNEGINKNNMSCTISIREHEWYSVGEWMWNNRDNYSGIATLPYDGGNYVQAPFESCSKEDYERLSHFVKLIDLTKIKELEDNTNLSGELACAGGNCEIS